MSNESWFKEFERLEAEHPDFGDATLSDMADEALSDKMADQADRALDEMKYRPADDPAAYGGHGPHLI